MESAFNLKTLTFTGFSLTNSSSQSYVLCCARTVGDYHHCRWNLRTMVNCHIDARINVSIISAEDLCLDGRTITAISGLPGSFTAHVRSVER